jgi:hypothetical protein
MVKVFQSFEYARKRTSMNNIGALAQDLVNLLMKKVAARGKEE